MNCILLAGFRVITFDAPLYTIGTTAVIIELVTGYFGGLTIASQVLHLMGAGLGFAVGAGMLKMGWVDCEGWDLFNVWAGTQNKARDEEADAAKKIVREATERRLQELTGRQDAAPAAASAPLTMDDLGSIGAPLETPQPSDQALADVRQAIAAGDPQQAFARFQRLAADPLTSELPEAELLRIIGLYHKQKLWSPSVPALVEYLRHFQAKETQVRLWLARILVQVEKRPAQALAVLAKLPADKLKDEERALAAQLRARAKQLQSPPSPNAASEH
jgi:hypothetical protein